MNLFSVILAFDRISNNHIIQLFDVSKNNFNINLNKEKKKKRYDWRIKIDPAKTNELSNFNVN